MTTIGHVRNDGRFGSWVPHIDVEEYPDAIDSLIALMEREPLDYRRSGNMIRRLHQRDWLPEPSEARKAHLCKNNPDFDWDKILEETTLLTGFWRFGGNFERVSAVFNVTTDDDETARKIKAAIRRNIQRFFADKETPI